ncbi:MAG TPA: hypothetical protein VK633_13380, partial [Verrucomicrobiae bacterium]|nr:hypothetical protein [Verrucomicrobiae bacterium]
MLTIRTMLILRLCITTWLLSCSLGFAGETRIIKVLPQLLDLHGRNAINPSLFDRDAYQLYLRQNPTNISALRFEVQYKAKTIEGSLLLRLELRGSKTELGKRHIFETQVKPSRWFASWGRIQLDQSTSEMLGSLVGWRATLLKDG